MSYYFSKKVKMTFDEAVVKITEELKKEGLGVLTEINVKETLKNKLNVDFQQYKILGACNPPFAYEALQTEDKIGLMLPCNVIVQEKSAGEIEISAIDPITSMQAIKNPVLEQVAEKVQSKLKGTSNNSQSVTPAKAGVQ